MARWTTRVAMVLGALVLSGPYSARGSVIVDDFNDGDDAGWTRYDPLAGFGAGGTFRFPDGGYRIQAPPSPLPGVLGPGRAGSARLDATFVDFRASVDLVAWDNGLEQSFGLVGRVREIGLGTSDGYALHYNTVSTRFPGSGVLVLERIDNEVPNPLVVAVAPLALDPNLDYRLVLMGSGPVLIGQAFPLTDLVTPLASVLMIDGTYQTGVTGLLVSDTLGGPNGAADATFDNFRAQAVPEPSTWGPLGLGLIGLFLPRAFVTRAFQRPALSR